MIDNWVSLKKRCASKDRFSKLSEFSRQKEATSLKVEYTLGGNTRQCNGKLFMAIGVKYSGLLH